MNLPPACSRVMITSAAETPFAFVDVGRDAAAVVAHGDRAVGVEDHLDPVAIAGQRLVDRVVDDLEHHVVQAGAVVGVADVHARPPAHRLQTLEHLDGGRIVAPRRRSARAASSRLERVGLGHGAAVGRIPHARRTAPARRTARRRAASVPVSQACAPSAQSSSNSAPRRAGSRWAATSSSRRIG